MFILHIELLGAEKKRINCVLKCMPLSENDKNNLYNIFIQGKLNGYKVMTCAFANFKLRKTISGF